MKRSGWTMWRLAVLAVTLSVLAVNAPLRAQQETPERSQFAGMEHLGGEITAVSGAAITIKTEDGQTRQIVTTTNTRIMRSRTTAKVADLKVGDGVMALGNLDGPNGTLHAAMVFATDAEQVKALRENLGKTYITGKVTAIDMTNATLTIERPDHVSQTIGLDENTSFKRGTRMGGGPPAAGTQAPAADAAAGESVTLADIKIGDNVHGTGDLKDGVFVPAQLLILPPGAGTRVRSRGAAAGTPPA